MSTLTLDLTPTLINRTAIFHIVMDTVQALRQDVAQFRFGRNYHDEPSLSEGETQRLAAGVMDAIFGPRELIQERWSVLNSQHRRPSQAGRILFFDPLYTLFEDLKPDDSVLVLDLTPVTDPHWHNPRVAELYEIAFRRLAASNARVGAISHHTAHALWANYGIGPDRTVVVPLYLRTGVRTGQIPASQDNRSKNFLFVGNLEMRKNLVRLFRAFERSRLVRDGYTLTVVGGDGHGAETIRQAAAETQGVRLTGFISDDELRALYQTAMGFVYPSCLEGFGLPIIEAASWGLPITTSTIGACAENAPPLSVLVDPYDVPNIADALRRMAALSASERAQMRAESLKHAAAFTFERYLSAMKNLIGWTAERDG